MKFTSSGKAPIFTAFHDSENNDFCKKLSTNVSYHLSILTLFVLLSEMLMNVYVIKRL